MHKKNIDKLFQEKLKNFAEVPEENVWHAIEASLDKKKKSRKVNPFWWKIGGAAAVLIFAFWAINPFGESFSNSPAVTESGNLENKPEIESNNAPSVQDIIPNNTNNEVVSTTNDLEDNSNKEATEASYVSRKEAEDSFEKKSSTAKGSSTQPSVQVAGTQSSDESRATTQNASTSTNKAFDVTKNTAADVVKNTERSKNDIKNPITNNTTEVVTTDVEEKESILSKVSDIAEVDTEKEEVEENKKKSIFDEIAETEEEAIADNSSNRWSAGPSVAPVYFNAIGEGSPVHSIFVANSKSGDLNLSYGLAITYKINEKLSVRSGLHRVDFGYDTNEVEFSSSLQASNSSKIDNINYTADSKNLVVVSNALPANVTSEMDAIVSNSIDVTSQATTSQNGLMSQTFGYLEIPIELTYALVDKKFGINLIGGVSSLFLMENAISVSSGDLTTAVGEANNINNLNFSTNVGLGINYNFTPKIQLNVEPVFKYQLNTFSGTDGTFQPYSVGIYSGVRYTF